MREQTVPEIISTSAKETFDFGRRLGRLLQAGDLVALTGALGAGKTCCIQGIAAGLGIAAHITVTSPTYTLIHEYPGPLPLYHFDVYRLAQEQDLYELGFEEYFYGRGVTVIEWADRIPALLPDDHLALVIRIRTNDARGLRLRAQGAHYQQLIHRLGTIEGDRDL